MRSKLLNSLTLFTACIFFFWHTASYAGFFDTEEKTPLPKFRVPTLSNTSKQMSNQTLTGHVALLNVWASWCRYCQGEHALLMEIKNNYNLPIYGLNVRDNPESARDYLKENGNPYTLVGVDWSGDVGNDLGSTGTPQTYIIDKHGVIRYHHGGALDKSDWENDMLPLIKKYESEK